MIFVAGGTGRLGQLVVRRLIESGHSIRVLTRDPSRAEQFGEKVDVAEGDVRDIKTLSRAMADIEIVVSAVQGFAGPGGVTPASVDRDGNLNLIKVAKEANVRFVLVSVAGASANDPMELTRMKHAAELALQASGVPWTIVRAGPFLELWIDMLRSTAGKSGRPLIFGRGENPINYVSVEDVARVVERACVDPSTTGRVLEVRGPENLSFNQLAALMLQTGALRGNPRHIPRPMLRFMAGTVGRIKPMLGGQMRASIVMDSEPMTFELPDPAEHDNGFVPSSPREVLERGKATAGDRSVSDKVLL